MNSFLPGKGNREKDIGKLNISPMQGKNPLITGFQKAPLLRGALFYSGDPASIARIGIFISPTSIPRTPQSLRS